MRYKVTPDQWQDEWSAEHPVRVIFASDSEDAYLSVDAAIARLRRPRETAIALRRGQAIRSTSGAVYQLIDHCRTCDAAGVATYDGVLDGLCPAHQPAAVA